MEAVVGDQARILAGVSNHRRMGLGGGGLGRMGVGGNSRVVMGGGVRKMEGVGVLKAIFIENEHQKLVKGSSPIFV